MSYFPKKGTLLDVRSPGEYAHAPIPGALSLPLFSDEERAAVGTCYKKRGKEKAFELGLQFVEPKLNSFIETASSFAFPLTLYCARGGLRSESMCALFSQAGIQTHRIEGGYKAFRNWALKTLSYPYTFHVLTGLTGSGKTELLHQKQARGEPILDLEALANHKGSVFGYQGPQPSNEHFENIIAKTLSQYPPDEPIWIEDESRMIGTCHIPTPIYNQIQQGTFIPVTCSEAERRARIQATYQNQTLEDLTRAASSLRKKLGHERTEKLLSALRNHDPDAVLDLLLPYYDKAYQHSLLSRSP
ncbi:MAG: tRNA 2-selenouridine synthase [Chlamydiae bacterium]|nr:tRNA 2-selenouridine synthase [Chlamydiota bacterium]